MKKLMAVFVLVALVVCAAPALAANPFMDVPAGHWAYDAVAQLASRGVVSGYPDGSYKGAQPATRYEMASIVARALAHFDTKANARDVELLKRLVLEFKSELDALGVKVNELDKRVAVLEDGVGGWKIRGIFNFDAKFGSEDGPGYNSTGNEKKNEFTKERFRLFLTKTINEDTYFYAQYRTAGRNDITSMKWSHIYVDTKLGWDVGFRVGRFAVDFEDNYGLYTDNDALFGDFRIDGFQLKKSFGMLNATAVIGRNFQAVGHEALSNDKHGYTEDHMAYILDLNLRPSEKFFIGATGYWGNGDTDVSVADYESNTYGFYAGYDFTPAIGLKGIYYFQDNDLRRFANAPFNLDDSPNAWKAILDVKQEALKFTSLWVEYSQIDNTFASYAFPRYSIGDTDAHVMYNRPVNNETTKVLFVKAGQKWNDKWGTWLRYAQADFGTKGIDDSREYGIGITYQYNPAILFELAYDYVDYGSGNAITYPGALAGMLNSPRNGDESVVRFRTSVSF